MLSWISSKLKITRPEPAKSRVPVVSAKSEPEHDCVCKWHKDPYTGDYHCSVHKTLITMNDILHWPRLVTRFPMAFLPKPCSIYATACLHAHGGF
jgi:hypothetical protein